MKAVTFYYRSAAAIARYLRQELNLLPRRHYHIVQAVSGPRILLLLMRINPHYMPRLIALAEQFSMAAGLDRGQSIRIARGNAGTLAFEIPKPPELWYDISFAAMPPQQNLLVGVGLDMAHHPALIDFGNAASAHCLIAGATGSGKTNVQRLLVYALARQNAPGDVSFLLIDVRKRGAAWTPFANLAHLLNPVVTDEAEALRVLTWAGTEIDRRAKAGRIRPRIFIGIDEAQALLEHEAFVRCIVDIAAVGREYGIHLLAALQNPTARQLGDAGIKRNLTTRLVGKVDSAQAAMIAVGLRDSGAERLVGAGDMLLVHMSQVRRITAALLRPDDLANLPRVAQVPALDFTGLGDVERVCDILEQEHDPAPEPVAYALAYPNASQREMYARYRIGFPKIKRAKAFAEAVLTELDNLGFAIAMQRNETVTKPA